MSINSPENVTWNWKLRYITSDSACMKSPDWVQAWSAMIVRISMHNCEKNTNTPPWPYNLRVESSKVRGYQWLHKLLTGHCKNVNYQWITYISSFSLTRRSHGGFTSVCIQQEWYHKYHLPVSPVLNSMATFTASIYHFYVAKAEHYQTSLTNCPIFHPQQQKVPIDTSILWNCIPTYILRNTGFCFSF